MSNAYIRRSNAVFIVLTYILTHVCTKPYAIYLVGGEDYGSVSTILTFSEESVKCIPIPIINDEEIETETETFSITLSLMSVSNQIQLQNSRATVEIIGKCIQ